MSSTKEIGFEWVFGGFRKGTDPPDKAGIVSRLGNVSCAWEQMSDASLESPWLVICFCVQITATSADAEHIYYAVPGKCAVKLADLVGRPDVCQS